MKYLFTSLVCFWMTTAIYGRFPLQVMDYLKDESVIHRFQIDQESGSSVKIRCEDTLIVSNRLQKTPKFIKQEWISRDSLKVNKLSYKGYFEFGYDIGLGELGADRFSLNVIQSLFLKPHISIGIGVGMRHYRTGFDYQIMESIPILMNSDSKVLIPIFGDLRFEFNGRKVAPFLSLGVGYSFDATQRFDAVGLLIRPSAGVRFEWTPRVSTHFGLGYEMQRCNIPSVNAMGVFLGNRNENLGALSLSLGVSF